MVITHLHILDHLCVESDLIRSFLHGLSECLSDEKISNATIEIEYSDMVGYLLFFDLSQDLG